jgi:FkbM family methyltransferase
VIEALNRARQRLFSGGGLRRRRAVTDLPHAIDLQGPQGLISKFEAGQCEIETSQREIKALLQARRSALALISPLELRTQDRYELEARCRALNSPVYLGDHTAICRLLGYYKLYVDTTDTGFSSHVLLDGCWEMWLTIFFARNLQPGMTVIDVGANFGYYTLLFGGLVGEKGHVYAIEPNPNVVPKLRRSVELNGLRSRTTIVSAAAGSADGEEVTLYAPHGEPKNATIITSPHVVSPNSGVIYQVPQVTVDQVVADAPHVDIVKIDAEGAEQTIIAGMTRTLTRDRPGLLLEFNAARYSDARAFIDQLLTIYDRMRYVDYVGNPAPITPSEAVTDRWGEDWLLFFDCSPPTAHSQMRSK